MKLFIFLSAIFLITIAAEQCSGKKKTGNNVYKAKLEIKAMCMNYTLTVTEGNIDTSLVMAKWTDETTGKSYTNAFGLGNPCDFPASIKQGDEFYFTIDTVKARNCAVCMAYYPTPPKKIIVKITENN